MNNASLLLKMARRFEQNASINLFELAGEIHEKSKVLAQGEQDDAWERGEDFNFRELIHFYNQFVDNYLRYTQSAEQFDLMDLPRPLEPAEQGELIKRLKRLKQTEYGSA